MKNMFDWFGSGFAKIAIVLAFVAMVVGCAAFKNIFSNPQNEATARVVVQVAVMDLVTQKPEFRDRILEITKDLRSYLDKEPEARAADVINHVRKEIHWNKLTPGQTLAATILLQDVQLRLEERIKQGGIDPEAKLKIIEVVEWVEQAAST